MTEQERQVAYLVSIGWEEPVSQDDEYRYLRKPVGDWFSFVRVGPRGGVYEDVLDWQEHPLPELRAPKGWMPE